MIYIYIYIVIYQRALPGPPHEFLALRFCGSQTITGRKALGLGLILGGWVLGVMDGQAG
jgi:hypothetical protein